MLLMGSTTCCTMVKYSLRLRDRQLKHPSSAAEDCYTDPLLASLTGKLAAWFNMRASRKSPGQTFPSSSRQHSSSLTICRHEMNELTRNAFKNEEKVAPSPNLPQCSRKAHANHDIFVSYTVPLSLTTPRHCNNIHMSVNPLFRIVQSYWMQTEWSKLWTSDGRSVTSARSNANYHFGLAMRRLHRAFGSSAKLPLRALPRSREDSIPQENLCGGHKSFQRNPDTSTNVLWCSLPKSPTERSKGS